MKVALVHDQLIEFGGAERVLIELKKIFPLADIYTTVYNPKKLKDKKNYLKNWRIYSSWFGRIPLVKNYYSPFRFLTPFIWESFDFSKYDLVISSSGSWMSKGIKVKKPTIHIAYLHHPPRYLYGYETAIEWKRYLPVKIYAYLVNHFLRIWDFYSSQRPDYLIANSYETKKRIKKFYRREATVIYPPVNIPKKISYKTNGENYYLTVSRLAKAKHLDLLIEAAKLAKFNLKIVGIGRDEKYLKSIADKNIEFLNHVSDAKLAKLYQEAKAFLFASVDEEFGIAPVEAMGYGLPVIAFRSGGIPEYLKDKTNGFLFNSLNPEALIETIKVYEKMDIQQLLLMKKNARKTAEKFSCHNFTKNILKFVNQVMNRKYARITRS